MNAVPITQEGLDVLKKELDKLLKEDRPRVIQAIEEARAHGDLSENAEYHAAKERQGFIESRIAELRLRVNSCQVEKIDGPYHRCVFGATVTLENIGTGEEKTYTLVGPFESAPEKNRISIATPIGQALLGREEGDEVRVKTPKGVTEYIIISIK